MAWPDSDLPVVLWILNRGNPDRPKRPVIPRGVCGLFSVTEPAGTEFEFVIPSGQTSRRACFPAAHGTSIRRRKPPSTQWESSQRLRKETKPNYIGLFESAEQTRPIEPSVLDALPVEFHRTVAIPPQTGALHTTIQTSNPLTRHCYSASTSQNCCGWKKSGRNRKSFADC